MVLHDQRLGSPSRTVLVAEEEFSSMYRIRCRVEIGINDNALGALTASRYFRDRVTYSTEVLLSTATVAGHNRSTVISSPDLAIRS